METKKEYKKPRIEWIPLDNEISLALQSDNPPFGPDEGYGVLQPALNNPFSPANKFA